MIWKLNKRTDVDLTSGNLKPWIDIFGVAWSYWGLIIDNTPVAIAYSANNDDSSDSYNSWHNSSFYDDWVNIICMWCVTASTQNGYLWKWFYYLEINKTSLVVTRYAPLMISRNVWINNSWVYMSIQNISWNNRYCFIDDFWPGANRWVSVYFNWTSLVEWWTSWTPIWETYYDLIQNYSINQLWWVSDTLNIASVTHFPWNYFWQTFNSWAWWDLNAIKVMMKNNWSSWNIVCEVYTWTFSALVWTSTNTINSLTTTMSWYRFDFSWITLSPSTAYSFKVYYTGSDSWSRVLFRCSNWVSLYPSGNLYRSWTSRATSDLTFKIIVWWFSWTIIWEKSDYHIIWTLNCYMYAMGMLKIT